MVKEKLAARDLTEDTSQDPAKNTRAKTWRSGFDMLAPRAASFDCECQIQKLH
jgi:hypothetical protein